MTQYKPNKAEQYLEDFLKEDKGVGTISNGTHYIEAKKENLIDLIIKVIEDENNNKQI